MTDALLSPAEPVERSAMVRDWRQRCHETLDELSTGCPRGRTLRVDGYLVRTALLDPQRLAGADEFRWSPRTARRLLGLMGLRHCVRGTCRTPAEAVAQAVEASVADAAEGRQRPGSLGHWLTTLHPGARAVVRAEAVTWATQVHAALEWERLRRPSVVGGADQWWSLPQVAGVSVRGRAEVRAPTRDDGMALFVVLNGQPGPSARAELGLPALVALLSGAVVPHRLLGWWPQSGRALVLPVDESLLLRTAEAVVLTVETVVAARKWPSGERRRAG